MSLFAFFSALVIAAVVIYEFVGDVFAMVFHIGINRSGRPVLVLEQMRKEMLLKGM